MNKIILAVIGILVLGIVVAALAFTTFFKTPESNEPNPTIGASPLYTQKYSKVIYPNELLTPGEIATNDLNIICYHYYDQLLVMVPEEITKQVYEEYMIAELYLGIIRDQIGEDMKENPIKWNIKDPDKISEQLINRRIHSSTKYQEYYKKFAFWKAKRKEWENHLEAVKQRSFSVNQKVNRG